MRKDFWDTIYLFSCGARGISPEPIITSDFDNIYRIAKSQGIWEVVFLSVKKLHEAGHPLVSEEVFKRLNDKFIMTCANQFRRYSFIHTIIDKLKEKGISCCILKGEAVARFYHTPIARISSDADLLIDKKQTAKCLQVLRDFGFQVGDIVYDSHQIECTHSICGLIEIHTKMYGNKTEDITFNGKVSYKESLHTFHTEDGASLLTLGPTDQAVFLFMHFIKHFISEGAGIRQLNDFLLYIEKSYDTIDWEHLNKILDELSFRRFFDVVTTIGKKYLHFNCDCFENEVVEDTLLSQVLEDMETGGIFGHDDTQRNGFYDLYLYKRYAHFNKGSFSNYKTKRKLHRLFPSRRFMSINYPYVVKSPLLLPVAWIHRFYHGIFETRKSVSISEAGSNRMALLEKLDMI